VLEEERPSAPLDNQTYFALDAGAAEDEGALAGLSGAGVPPPHAARAPTAAIAARTTRIAMFFMFNFSSG
jgi:hypothetical protein